MTGEALTTHASLTMDLVVQFLGRDLHNGDAPMRVASVLVGAISAQAATTLIRAAFRDRGFFRMTISTSWSSAVSRFIRRSTEKPASL